MKKKLLRIALVFVVLLALALLAVFLFRKDIVRHYSPQIEQLGHIDLKVIDDTTYVSARLAIHNVAPIQVEIDTLSYNVTLFDKTYMTGNTDMDVMMPAHGHDTIDFKLKIPHAALLQDAKAARREGDSASYAIDASIRFLTFFGSFDVPVSKSSKIKIPTPPDLDIADMQFQKFGLKHIRALASIRVGNKNQVAMNITSLRYNLEIPGRANLEGTYGKTIAIKPLGETNFDLPLDIELQKVGKTIIDILKDRDIYDYTLHIVARIETTEPVDQTFQVDVIKHGEMELKK